jgi:cytochrome c biogenesis protein CcmG/thiol:disulfide interchange protein DsbE
MTTSAQSRAWRRWRTVGIGAAVSVAVLAGIAILTSGRSGNRLPHKAPTFAVADLRQPDQTIKLTALRGTPVVLNFWATWCVPCRQEMPDLEAVHRSLGLTVAFLGINNRDSRRPAAAFLRTTKVTYPTGFDPDGQIAAAYEVLGMPTTVFISADGTVLAKHTGQLKASTLRADIRRYFHLQASDPGGALAPTAPHPTQGAT